MQRILFIDLAKGFTVLFIPAIHCVMLYSQPGVHNSWLGIILSFIAEWPGAQLLMLLMGMSLSFSKKSTPAQLIRGVIIFLSGYLLNVLKFLLPFLLGILPTGFLTTLNFSHDTANVGSLLSIGDIFHCAGISIILLALIKKLDFYPLYAVFFCFVVNLSAPLLWNMHHHTFILDHFFHLIGGHPDDTFFPLFPWLVYPLTGLAIGRYVQSSVFSIWAIFIPGCFLFLASLIMSLGPYHFPTTSFWRTWPDATNMHLGFVMIWISLWYWIAKRMEPIQPTVVFKLRAKENCISSPKVSENPLVQLLCFCSKNITAIYLIQWIIIFWLLPLIGHQQQDILTTLFYSVNITVAALTITYFITKKNLNYKYTL